ncbi:AP2 domain-containing protein [Halalkalibacterium halodurans]|uniref:AP2 domain-containing protein n=1 Tax=Halalkalibacterium halodurans TaxID=86665 RepID=UPI0006A97C78|nr:AP2 domain-containing protein [Halalkalibacterium halodurans]TPE70688.1 AP2 domain-containing protein [Halalkalibacterium halodurans]
MARPIIPGERFGKLTVIKEADQDSKYRFATVKCDCGTEKNVRFDQLTSEKTKSCGCIQRKSEVGKRFGKLFVIEELTERAKDGRKQYKCRCDCGNVITTKGVYLRQGDTLSCGCVKINIMQNGKNRGKIDNTNIYSLKKKIQKNNTSGAKGVSYSRTLNKWVAYININKRKINLGAYAKKEDAIKARLDAEEKYHKPYLNH